MCEEKIRSGNSLPVISNHASPPLLRLVVAARWMYTQCITFQKHIIPASRRGFGPGQKYDPGSRPPIYGLGEDPHSLRHPSLFQAAVKPIIKVQNFPSRYLSRPRFFRTRLLYILESWPAQIFVLLLK